jgi:hypothetical protein
MLKNNKLGRASVVFFIVALLCFSSLAASIQTVSYLSKHRPVQKAVTPSSAPQVIVSSGSTSIYGFNFPFVYEQPSVPRNVGVQGISGLTVPLADLGPTGKVGPTGHLGPVNVSNPIALTSTVASVSILVYNGTFQPLSRSVSVGSIVTFQNISLYKFYSAITGKSGYANFSLPEGWYFLSIRDAGSSYITFSQEIDIQYSVTLIRYLIPSSNSTAASVGNGPSSTLKNGYINVNLGNGVPASQITVTIYNGTSGSGAPLVRVVTNNQGYANYSGLSSDYSYSYLVNGYEQTATGTRLYLTNVSGSFSAGNNICLTLNGRTSWTASVSGPEPSQGYENIIGISGNLVFKGGIVVLSAPLSTASYSMTFINTVVYLNSSVTLLNMPKMYFYNSTIFELSGLNPFGIDGIATQLVKFDNSIVFFSSVNITAVQFNPSSSSAQNDVQGPWIAGDAYSSIFVAPFSGDPTYSTVTGLFANSEFFRFNMTGSNVPGTDAVGHAFMNNVEVVNSTIESSFLVFNHSSLQGFYSFNDANTIWFNDSNISFLNYGNHYVTEQSIYATHDTFSTMLSSTGGVTLNPEFANVTYSIFNFTPKSASLRWVHMGLGGTHLQLYNDYFISYPNLTLRKEILNLETGSYQGWGMSVVPQFLQMDYTWVYGMDAIGFEPANSLFNWNFSHDNFSNGWSDQEWNPFEWFTKNVSGYIPTANFNNDTFYGFHYDPAVWWKQWNLSTDVTIGYFQDLNLPNPPTTTWGRIYMNYSTIFNVGIGTNDGYAFGMSEGGIATYFNDNVFLNDPHTIFTEVGTAGWYNGSYMQVPFANDIEHAAGSLFLTNNWFLNLTNQTMPAASLIGSGGQGRVVSIDVSNNHYYYYPNMLQSSIPTFLRPPLVPFDNNSIYNFPPGVHRVTHANYSYEIPMNSYGQFISTPYQDQYVFNSSILQQNPFNYYPNSVYAYVVEPDVNTSSGHPVISFYGGLVGGIQPDFNWNKSTYSLAVEPNMTYISTSNTSASPISIEFNVPPGYRFLDIWMYNSSSGKIQLIKRVPEYSYTYNTTVSFDPSTMTTAAVFFTNQTRGYTLTFTESGLPNGTAWSVRLNGTAVSSQSTSIEFEVGNGTYSFVIPGVNGYVAKPSDGAVNVTGADINISVYWSEAAYSVNFQEKGLPQGSTWNVSVNGTVKEGNGRIISYSEGNGIYTYRIWGTAGYKPDLPSGQILVNDSNITVAVSFYKWTYQVIFQAKGLRGQWFSVILNGSVERTNSSQIVFNEPNGSYNYSIISPTNFKSSPDSGYVEIHGSSVTVPVTFIFIKRVTITFGVSYLSNLYIVSVSALLVISAIGTFFVYRKTRRASYRK